jgi:large subunit ribosomal protein L14
MVRVTTLLRAADNAGGILFKCIRVDGGFKRRFSRLGEMVGAVSKTRKSYKVSPDKMKKAKIAKKVKKTRKKKDKKFRPYLNLLVALAARTKRADGSYIRFDENRVVSLKEPRTFGPAGKT